MNPDYTGTPHDSHSEDSIPEKYRNSTQFGPGSWFSLHTYAANSFSAERKAAFIDFVNIITSNLKCHICRGHAIQYVTANPPALMYNLQDPDGREIGLFKWTWIFHNAVNRRLGYPEMSFDDAYRIFNPYNQNQPGCVRNCNKLREDEYQNQTIPLRYSRSPTSIPNNRIVYSNRNDEPNMDNSSNINQQISYKNPVVRSNNLLIPTPKTNAGLSFKKINK
jgi:hypothetical protein